MTSDAMMQTSVESAAEPQRRTTRLDPHESSSASGAGAPSVGAPEVGLRPPHRELAAPVGPTPTILLDEVGPVRTRLLHAALAGAGFAVVPVEARRTERAPQNGTTRPTTLLAYLDEVLGSEATPREILARHVVITARPNQVPPTRELEMRGLAALAVLDLRRALAPADDAARIADTNLRAAILKATILADVLHLSGLRLRPYELSFGAADRALDECTEIVCAALESGRSLVVPLLRCRRLLGAVRIERTRPRPLVAIESDPSSTDAELDTLRAFVEAEGGEVALLPSIFELLDQAGSSSNGNAGTPATLRQRGVRIGTALLFDLACTAVGLSTISPKHSGAPARNRVDIEVGPQHRLGLPELTTRLQERRKAVFEKTQEQLARAQISSADVERFFVRAPVLGHPLFRPQLSTTTAIELAFGARHPLRWLRNRTR